VVITETMPQHTRFNAAAGSTGWSCPNLSPPGTMCTYAVGTLPANTQQVVFFGVTVDSLLDVPAIFNSVQIIDAEGGSADGGDTALVAAEAPTLDAWALAGALAMLISMAALRLRRQR